MNRQEHNCETGEIINVELTDDEIAELEIARQLDAWASIRSRRDAMLKDSDWTVLSDTPTSTAAWKTYRQELRDLPANTTDPFDVVWPTPPA